MAALEQLLRDSTADKPGPARNGDGQRQVVRPRRREDRADGLRAVLEDAQQLPLDQPVTELPERAERELVLDLVLDPRATVRLPERVGMDPAAVWPADLHVAERERRREAVDPRLPSDGDAEKRCEPVLDLQAFAHLEVAREEAEAHARWRDPREIARFCEECEHFIDGSGNELASAESVRGHGSASGSVKAG